VPWALRRNNRNYPPTADDIEKGKKWLEKLIDRFDALKVVVLCGNKAQKPTGFLYIKHTELCVLHAPHASPKSMNQEARRKHLRAAIEKAARILSAGAK
jgi:uracil-DNA glycosylase